MPCDSQTEYGKIIVSGAGIAGLASALFIARAGYQVEIFEQTSKLDPVGSGIQLSPNAMSVLAALGLNSQVKAVAIAPTVVEVYDALPGEKIVDIPLQGEIAEKYEQPYVVIHRADLQKILFQACQRDKNITLFMGQKILKAKSFPNVISVVTDRGGNISNHHGLALVAADGVHSIIRNHHFKHSKEQFTKTHILRALVRSRDIPNTLKDETIKIWLAPGAHAVFYPVCSGSHYNILLTVGKKIVKNRLTGSEIAEKLIAAKWGPHFLKLLENDTEWTVWPIFEVPKLQKWYKGNILLLGDAAHAIQPHAAQGAAMGLEDAATLGWALGKNYPLPRHVFEQYQHNRIKRVNAVRNLSGKNRMLYHLPSGLASVRNIGMRVMKGARIINRYNEVYQWNPPR